MIENQIEGLAAPFKHLAPQIREKGYKAVGYPYNRAWPQDCIVIPYDDNEYSRPHRAPGTEGFNFRPNLPDETIWPNGK